MTRAIILISLLAMAATPASAQFVGGALGTAARHERTENPLSRSATERSADPHETPQGRDTQSPRRLRRAQQAAEMINNGDCAGALTLANNAHDTLLVERVTEVCNGGTVSAPVATSGTAAPR